MRKAFFISALFFFCISNSFASVSISVDKLRPKPGEKVKVDVKGEFTEGTQVYADVLEPGYGVKRIEFSKSTGGYEASIQTSESSKGLWNVTVYSSGDKKLLGKAHFITGYIVGDFFIVGGSVPEKNTKAYMSEYLNGFSSIGGNFMVAHYIINGKQAMYPSKVCKLSSKEDYLGMFLDLCDKEGYPVLISISWDFSRPMPYSEMFANMQKIISELWVLYAKHPSFAGFYCLQEGSGLDLALLVRQFCDYVKSVEPTLLTGCAPYVNDAVLAGYLAAIDNLDIVIYQGQVMASYRTDNRLCFPINRTRDNTCLANGANLIKNKITLCHFEIFGPAEKAVAGKYLAPKEDIITQIWSAATIYGTDGITIFTYHDLFNYMKDGLKEAKEDIKVTAQGYKDFDLIFSKIANIKQNPIVFYYPYTDFCVHYWREAFLPAFGALRSLGIPFDIIPFIPPVGEEIPPFYPMNLNTLQLDYLLKNKFVVVLPDVSGMQETDSILLKRFIEEGGIVILFGHNIPYGDRFARKDLCGGNENKATNHSDIIMKETLANRIKAGENELDPSLLFSSSSKAIVTLKNGDSVLSTITSEILNSPSWTPTTAKPIAVFEDGSSAVMLNNFGKGKVLTIPLSLTQAAEVMPDLVRDIFDYALKQNGNVRPFDILGGNKDMDFAMATLPNESRVAMINHTNKPVEMTLLPLTMQADKKYKLVNMRNGKVIKTGTGKELSNNTINIKAFDFSALSLLPTE
ncbi:MAG: hypothetical protein PHX21_05600 [bacterium]|nr:hypothetical protein [bacterium]